MEYNYIDDIDNVIEDKTKLKELLLLLLNTNVKRYDDYDAEQLFDLFLQIPLDNFITTLNNMICYEYRLELFNEHIHRFTSRRKVDERDKLFFLLEKDYIVRENDSISFIEHLFLSPKYENQTCLQYLIEYYEENDELDELQEKIKKFEIMTNKQVKNYNLYNSFEFLNKFFTNKYIKANYSKEKQDKLINFFKFFKNIGKNIKKGD